MANEVYANNNEIACKAGAGKSICAFPDVCMTPPENPATPPGVPVPYPNTGFASDTTQGSRTVQISGKEVMLKNKSYFKKSTGDEAGCAAKKGVVTSTNRNKVYFIAWSMDVKIEGENADRHLDMTTHNHASPMANEAAPMVYIDAMAIVYPESCRENVDRYNEACSGPNKTVTRTPSGRTDRVQSCSDACRLAQRCILIPKKYDKRFCCPETEGPLLTEDTLRTGHHLIEDQWIKTNPNFPWYSSDRGTPDASTVVPPENPGRNPAGDPPAADVDDAPTVCSNHYRTPGTPHNELHDVQGVFVEQFRTGGPRAVPGKPNNGFNYGAAKECAKMAHRSAFPDADCKGGCLDDQFDAFYGSDNERPMNLPTSNQGLSTRRGDLHNSWERVNTSSEGLKASIGDMIRARS